MTPLLRPARNDVDRVADLVEQAWLLGDEDIASLAPGVAGVSQLGKILDPRDLHQHPFAKLSRTQLDQLDLTVLRVLRDPHYISYTCQTLLSMNGTDPLRVLPIHAVALQELWWRKFPMLVASRGWGKTTYVAINILLKLLFNQGIRIVVVGKAFRQAIQMFETCERLWYNSPLLRDLVGSNPHGKKNGPRYVIDRREFIIGDSVAVFLPLGDGETIRGLRANIVVADEFKCLDASTIVETDTGLYRIGDVEPHLDSLRLTQPQGDPIAPDRYFRTPPVAAYRVTAENGYDFICSDIHRAETTKGWKRAVDLVKGDRLVFPNKYQFPTEPVRHGTLTVSNEVAWLLGTLVAEGSVSDKYVIGMKNTDLDYVERTKVVLEAVVGSEASVDYRGAYTDDRGWDCKESWTVRKCNLATRDELEALGLERVTAPDKKVPWAILRSPRDQVVRFLAGLFEGDGSIFHWKLNTDPADRKRLGVSFYSSSEQLAREVQLLLHKLGFPSYRTKRRSKLSVRWQWMVRLNGEHAHNLAKLLNIPSWNDVEATADRPLIRANCGACLLKSGVWRASIGVDGKAKALGCYKTRDEALEAVRRYRDANETLKVRSVEKLPGERVLYDFTVPDTHAFFGNGFVQHNSLSEQVYSSVVQGFAAVASDPVDKACSKAREKVLRRLGMWTNELTEASKPLDGGNQSILAGTAYLSFNHFYRYWTEYRSIIHTGGDEAKLEEVLKGPVPPGFDWRNYSIMRIPYSMIPEGYMDLGTVARAKAVSTSSVYLCEYETIFVKDTDGFFRRTVVERATIGCQDAPIPEFPSCGPVEFTAAVSGKPGVKYVVGVDPAMQHDNFGVVVVEAHPDHRRVVYCWTTNKLVHRNRKRNRHKVSADYWRYCTQQLREIFRRFPPSEVLLDAGGGGLTIKEALSDPDKLEDGEKPIYETIDPLKPRDTDRLAGDHILRMVQFRDNSWTSEANWSLKKDLEDRALLFPRADEITFGLAHEADRQEGRVRISAGAEVRSGDTLEDILLEIDELKNELCTIVHTASPSGLERWDTPDAKDSSVHKKGRLRKDRYSALLMANWGARRITGAQPASPFAFAYGRFAGGGSPSGNGAAYQGPAHVISRMPPASAYGAMVQRRR